MKKQKNPKKIILGITGSFGTGKSTVCQLLAASGAKVIDADLISYKLLQPRQPGYRKVVDFFGSRILKKNKAINRQVLGKIVFDDQRLLKALDRMMHPLIISEIKKQISRAKSKLVVVDAPLLFETGLADLFDQIVVVKAGRQKQFSRLLEKTALSKADIVKRLNTQMPLSIKIRKADFVIDNSSTIEKTRKQVEYLRRNLWKS